MLPNERALGCSSVFPQFPQRAREDLAKWQIDEPLLEQLLDGLRLAGLDIV
jgi:hypothetical protein